MPTFREVNTGQVVTLDEDPSYLSGLARWQRIEAGLSAPEPETPQVELIPETPVIALKPETPVVAATPDPVDELPSLNATTAVWAKYALDHGKSKDEVAGKRRSDIIAWFDVPTQN